MAGINDLLNVVSTTLNAWSPKVFDNVTNNNALLYYFKNFGKLGLYGKSKEKTGSIETKNGGKQIEEDVSILSNSNVGFVAYNETVPTAAVDVLNHAVFDWKYAYGNAVLYDAQILSNADSKYRKHKLVEEVINNAEATMVNVIGAGLWNSSDADSINGIPALITDTGASVAGSPLGAIGGILTTAYAGWANQFVNLAKNPTAADLLNAMGNLYRKCSRGASTPDLIVTNPDTYGLFESALTSQQRFTNPKLADAGFESLKFHGATVIFDQNAPANRVYFLNTKAMAFNVHAKANFAVGEMEKLYGQQQYCWGLKFMGNFSVRSRRDLGVIVIATS